MIDASFSMDLIALTLNEVMTLRTKEIIALRALLYEQRWVTSMPAQKTCMSLDPEQHTGFLDGMRAEVIELPRSRAAGN